LAYDIPEIRDINQGAGYFNDAWKDKNSCYFLFFIYSKSWQLTIFLFSNIPEIIYAADMARMPE
jgi:hypothetical protein